MKRNGLIINISGFTRQRLNVSANTFLSGLGYDLDYHFNIGGDSGVNLQQFTGYQYGLSGNSLSSGITFNFLYDTRNRKVYPFPGSFLYVIYRVNPGFLGNTNSWQSIFVDVRKYIPLNKPSKPDQQNLLTFWSFLWWNFSNYTPYLDLPSTGWDEYNRSAGVLIRTDTGESPYIILKPNIAGTLPITGFLDLLFFPISIRSADQERCFNPGIRPAVWDCAINSVKLSNTNFAIDYAFSKGYRTVLFNFSETF